MRFPWTRPRAPCQSSARPSRLQSTSNLFFWSFSLGFHSNAYGVYFGGLVRSPSIYHLPYKRLWSFLPSSLVNASFGNANRLLSRIKIANAKALFLIHRILFRFSAAKPMPPVKMLLVIEESEPIARNARRKNPYGIRYFPVGEIYYLCAAQRIAQRALPLCLIGTGERRALITREKVGGIAINCYTAGVAQILFMPATG